MRLTNSLPVLRRIHGFNVPSLRAVLPAMFSVALALALAAVVTERMLMMGSSRIPAEPVQVIALGDGASRTQAADLSPVAVLLGDQTGNNAGQVRLLGVIAQGSRGEGLAIVSIDGQAARVVRAGSSLGPDVTLTEVRVDHVLLERAGALQEVRLPPKKLMSAGIQPASRNRDTGRFVSPPETARTNPGGKSAP
jgi:general secretion pathway protein C